MKTVRELESENYLLGVKIRDLEGELERKDEIHLHDLTLMKKQMEAIMNKYLLN